MPTTLRVTEALQQDVSYGRARIDQTTREALNLAPGDIIMIEGKTSAVVWRSHPGDEGKGLIHIDNLVRKNAGVSLGQGADIEKVSPDNAFYVVLEPAVESFDIQFGEGVSEMAKRCLMGRTLSANDIVVVPDVMLFGNTIPFRVVGLGHTDFRAKCSRVTVETDFTVRGTAGEAPQPIAPKATTADDALSAASLIAGFAFHESARAYADGKREVGDALVIVTQHALEITKTLQAV